MKKPIFFLDADDDLGNRTIGASADRVLAEANLHAEIQSALDRLELGGDGSKLVWILKRIDMTDKELAALPEGG